MPWVTCLCWLQWRSGTPGGSNFSCALGFRMSSPWPRTAQQQRSWSAAQQANEVVQCYMGILVGQSCFALAQVAVCLRVFPRNMLVLSARERISPAIWVAAWRTSPQAAVRVC